MSNSNDLAATDWEELVEVGKFPTVQKAHEYGLVILAMRQPCWVNAAGPIHGYTLHAEPEAAPKVIQELIAYEKEQQVQPAISHTKIFHFHAGWGAYAVWILSLICVFIWQDADPTLVEKAASSGAGLIERHEYWRPFTALFLHADVSHLAGNMLSGLLFGTLVARSIGALKAWLLILLCGTIGNALTSFITYPEPLVSIGASTAVFSALGILSGLGFTSLIRIRQRLSWAKVAAPIFAGIILLGWLGGGRNEHTDVIGHVLGFTTGLSAGLLVGWINPKHNTP
ncbi:MAG: rhomboid family intramembrane serine protease [Gloeobacteraceae cyanobacterium ES-bin-144]|nr:rhomboid family intramembrane serine protease [Verrucomicrobiales bacterium]